MNLLINLIDPSDTLFTAELVQALQSVFNEEFDVVINDFATPAKQDKMYKVTKLLNQTFDVIIGITMFLCLFALSANMSANINSQTKEIACLRAMGFTKWRIRLLYFYEALILVLASSLLGIFTGMTVGYTVSLQQKLLLDTDLPFFFPTEQFLVILGISGVCAFISTFAPANRLMGKEIAVIFRLV